MATDEPAEPPPVAEPEVVGADAVDESPPPERPPAGDATDPAVMAEPEPATGADPAQPDNAGGGEEVSAVEDAGPIQPDQPGPAEPSTTDGGGEQDAGDAPTCVDPSSPESPHHFEWQEGYDAGFAAPAVDHPTPAPYSDEAASAFEAGLAAGVAAARSQPAPSDSDPNTPATDDGSALAKVPVTLKFQFDLPLPKRSLGYVEAEGKLFYKAECKPAGVESMTETEIGVLQHEVESKVKAQLTKKVALTGGGEVDGQKGHIFVKLEWDIAEDAKTEIAFEIVAVDEHTGQVKFALLKWEGSYRLIGGTFQVGNVPVEWGGWIGSEIEFSPNWAEIGKYAAEKLGLEIVADGAVAGGTGMGGAAAISVAPAAGVIGGIVGGIALCAGVCAAIGKAQELGDDAMQVCQAGWRELHAYAVAYGATMRGGSGDNAPGNADAEAALQKIMQNNPGITREQAIQAAIETKNNYEDIAWRALLPVLRERIEQEYKAKEGRLGFFFSGNVLHQVMDDVLPPESNFR